MPSTKVLNEKKEIVNALTERLKNSAAGILVDYKGISVEQDTQLRKNFREANVEYNVIKNTLLRFAVTGAELSELTSVLEGTTALATSAEDAVAPAKVFSDFLKANDKLELTIKAGFLDGKILSPDEVKALASIPPKEVLLTQVLYAINAPVTSFAFAVKALADKLEEKGENAVAADIIAAAETPAAEEAPAEETAAPETPAETPAE